MHTANTTAVSTDTEDRFLSSMELCWFMLHSVREDQVPMDVKICVEQCDDGNCHSSELASHTSVSWHHIKRCVTISLCEDPHWSA